MAKKKKAKKRTRVVGYTVPIKVGSATVRIKGKTERAAKANASRFCRNHLKNVTPKKNLYFDGIYFGSTPAQAKKARKAGEKQLKKLQQKKDKETRKRLAAFEASKRYE